MTIHEVRNIIASECLDHIKTQEGNLIFRTFTGSGKTTTVLKTLYNSDAGLNWMYFAPYHAVIEENIEFSSVVDYQDVLHLKGRDKLCLSKEYREYAKNGINIQPFCENFCTKKDSGCPYYENLRKLTSNPCCFAGVHAHIPTLLQQLLYQDIEDKYKFYMYYDVIVIDEFPTNTIYNQLSLSRKDIEYARDILEMVGIFGKEYIFLKAVMEKMFLATKSVGINVEKIKEYLNVDRGLDFENFKNRYDIRVLELINEKKISKPPEDIVYMLIRIYKENPSLEKLKWMIKKTENTEWMKGRFLITVSNLDYFNLPVKVIALDGTADLQTWRTVLGPNTDSIKYDLEYKNTYQIVGARNPVSSIIRNGEITDNGIDLIEMLKIICDYRDTNVLVCCNNRIERLIKKHLKLNNVQFANYYNLRSRNIYYETCDVCVIFHEPNIPPFQAKIIEHVLGIPSYIVIKIHREDEMKQGIGRIRMNIPITPNGRKRKLIEVFIFSATGKDRLVEEANYFSKTDLIAYLKTGKKKFFYAELEEFIKDSTPTTKRELQYLLDMPRNKVDHLLQKLELENKIRIDWGKVEWIYPEQQFRIKVG